MTSGWPLVLTQVKPPEDEPRPPEPVLTPAQLRLRRLDEQQARIAPDTVQHDQLA